MSDVPCAHEFCDLEHETPVPTGGRCRCTVCKRGPFHHPVCCRDHFREQHRRAVGCEPAVRPSRWRVFARAR